jgi:hypothetical protein
LKSKNWRVEIPDSFYASCDHYEAECNRRVQDPARILAGKDLQDKRDFETLMVAIQNVREFRNGHDKKLRRSGIHPSLSILDSVDAPSWVVFVLTGKRMPAALVIQLFHRDDLTDENIENLRGMVNGE